MMNETCSMLYQSDIIIKICESGFNPIWVILILGIIGTLMWVIRTLLWINEDLEGAKK